LPLLAQRMQHVVPNCSLLLLQIRLKRPSKNPEFAVLDSRTSRKEAQDVWNIGPDQQDNLILEKEAAMTGTNLAFSLPGLSRKQCPQEMHKLCRILILIIWLHICLFLISKNIIGGVQSITCSASEKDIERPEVEVSCSTVCCIYSA